MLGEKCINNKFVLICANGAQIHYLVGLQQWMEFYELEVFLVEL